MSVCVCVCECVCECVCVCVCVCMSECVCVCQCATPHLKVAKLQSSVLPFCAQQSVSDVITTWWARVAKVSNTSRANLFMLFIGKQSPSLQEWFCFSHHWSLFCNQNTVFSAKLKAFGLAFAYRNRTYIIRERKISAFDWSKFQSDWRNGWETDLEEKLAKFFSPNSLRQLWTKMFIK